MALTEQQVLELRHSELEGPNKLRKAIKLARVTQVEVAAAVGIRQPHVSEIANGNYSSLPLETARDLATFFGCTIDDLFPRPQTPPIDEASANLLSSIGQSVAKGDARC